MALFIAVAVILLVVFIIAINAVVSNSSLESPSEAAGRYGEETASNIIQRILREDDLLFRNVLVSYDGKEAELDNVIVNKNGVFIIEVKNYSGRLEGTEDDFEWVKYHTSYGGNTYIKTVKNPIKQVKRQIYILAHYLSYYGVDVWVDGYAFLLESNSPVLSEYVLPDAGAIDHALHCCRRKRISPQTISAVEKLRV